MVINASVAVIFFHQRCLYSAGSMNGVSQNSGPTAGGGARVGNLSANDATRIQNAANRANTQISVVGSQANGTAGPNSDWDYVVPGGTSNQTIHSLSSSLPEGPGGLGDPRAQDFFRGTIAPQN
jgi:hypothetical protein